MGFLLGAFGKQMAGTRYRSLQARLMKISARVRRVHREQERMQKALEREYKSSKAALQFETQSAIAMSGNTLLGSVQDIAGQLGKDVSLTTDKDYMVAQMRYSQVQAAKNTELQYKLQQLEDNYERAKENLLEPLKDEEEELSSEKDMLEGQRDLAKEEYEACKKMEQADIKMIVPSYTGGQA